MKLYEGNTPENGVIRLENRPHGFVLWYHGEIVWMSASASNTEKRTRPERND